MTTLAQAEFHPMFCASNNPNSPFYYANRGTPEFYQEMMGFFVMAYGEDDVVGIPSTWEDFVKLAQESFPDHRDNETFILDSFPDLQEPNLLWWGINV
jgi:hypothetical protein